MAVIGARATSSNGQLQLQRLALVSVLSAMVFGFVSTLSLITSAMTPSAFIVLLGQGLPLDVVHALGNSSSWSDGAYFTTSSISGIENESLRWVRCMALMHDAPTMALVVGQDLALSTGKSPLNVHAAVEVVRSVRRT